VTMVSEKLYGVCRHILHIINVVALPALSA